MKRMIMLSIAAALIAAAPLAITPAQAAGCLRGAVAGGVVGHLAGHHGLVGAGIGCAIGHHEATVRSREDYRDRDYRDRY
jgi:hypothetical protein